MHTIYLLKEFWYQAYLWERPEGGGRNMRAAQCLGVLQAITVIMKGDYVVHKKNEGFYGLHEPMNHF